MSLNFFGDTSSLHSLIKVILDKDTFFFFLPPLICRVIAARSIRKVECAHGNIGRLCLPFQVQQFSAFVVVVAVSLGSLLLVRFRSLGNSRAHLVRRAHTSCSFVDSGTPSSYPWQLRFVGQTQKNRQQGQRSSYLKYSPAANFLLR